MSCRIWTDPYNNFPFVHVTIPNGPYDGQIHHLGLNRLIRSIPSLGNASSFFTNPNSLLIQSLPLDLNCRGDTNPRLEQDVYGVWMASGHPSRTSPVPYIRADRIPQTSESLVACCGSLSSRALELFSGPLWFLTGCELCDFLLLLSAFSELRLFVFWISIK